MMDDMDRDCCHGIKQMVRNGIELDNHRWSLESEKLTDPGWILVYKHEFGPHVTVTIQYGDRSET